MNTETLTRKDIITATSSNENYIEVKHLKNGQIWEFISKDYKILCINDGELKSSIGEYANQSIREGQIIPIPLGSQFKGVASKNTNLTIIRIKSYIKFASYFSNNRIFQTIKTSKIDSKLDFCPIILETKELLQKHICLLQQCLIKGISYPEYMDNKIQELIYIMQSCYPLEDLARFFYPLVSNDWVFSDLIYKNYRKVKTEKELAELSFYSISGFRKRFKKIFGVSPSFWLKEKRAEDIRHELYEGIKSAKQISYDHGFCSPAHFNDFCKQYLGATPGELRSQKMIVSVTEA